MYFPDLSPYFDYRMMLAIGWLDQFHDYAEGTVSADVPMQLSQLMLMKKDVNKMRGTHKCPFCEFPQVYIGEGDNKRLLGMSEFWVPGKGEIIYVAPSLIYHYIVSHKYKPPQEFIDAVLQIDFTLDWNSEAEMEARISKDMKEK